MFSQVNAFDEMANLLASGIEPERLIAYEIPLRLIERYQFLVDKEKNEEVSTSEKSELDSLLMINHVISMAKLMALKKLAAA
ncbi:hypothetical protein [Haliscomenobacter sp.]|jgi:hypothetical protein|uniref:hypothetical protein n=1 Tax=Haliscomenobacter sp. TaxID=2717303 RepID=UPI00336504A4